MKNRDIALYRVKLIDKLTGECIRHLFGLKDLFTQCWDANKYDIVYIAQSTGIPDYTNCIIFEHDIVRYVTGNPKRYVYGLIEYGEYETYSVLEMDANGQFITSTPPNGEIEKHVGFYVRQPEMEITADYPLGKLPLVNLWLDRVGHMSEHAELLAPFIEKQDLSDSWYGAEFQPERKLTGIEQYNQYKDNDGTMSFTEWYADGRYDKSADPTQDLIDLKIVKG